MELLTKPFCLVLIFFAVIDASGQSSPKFEWYSESTTDGITIQNSFPRGGPYTGPGRKHFSYSRLVFFTRVVNNSANAVELSVDFLADSVAIPGSPETYMKIFLPPDTMKWDRRSIFNYGVKDMVSIAEPTSLRTVIDPGGEYLFYVIGIFYQTKPNLENQPRGGNRAEFVLRGQDLFFRMPPQIGLLKCGGIASGR